VAERLWREVGESQIADQKGRASVCIGVALYPSRDARSKDALLRAADTALRQAKRDGGNRVCVFQQEGYIYTPFSVESASPEFVPKSSRRGGN